MSKEMTKQATEQARFREAWARNLRTPPDAAPDRQADMRWLNNYFVFWVACERGACKRAKRCAGDAKACFDRLWPHVPERMKFEFRGYLKAFNEGLSLEQAMRKVKADLEQWADHIAQAEARQLAEIRRMDAERAV